MAYRKSEKLLAEKLEGVVSQMQWTETLMTLKKTMKKTELFLYLRLK
jgi:hypothetical protein